MDYDTPGGGGYGRRAGPPRSGGYGDGGGGGGGYSGGGGGYHKRKRQEEPVDPLKQLLSTLIYLGDDALPVRAAAGTLPKGRAFRAGGLLVVAALAGPFGGGFVHGSAGRGGQVLGPAGGQMAAAGRRSCQSRVWARSAGIPAPCKLITNWQLQVAVRKKVYKEATKHGGNTAPQELALDEEYATGLVRQLKREGRAAPAAVQVRRRALHAAPLCLGCTGGLRHGCLPLMPSARQSSPVFGTTDSMTTEGALAARPPGLGPKPGQRCAGCTLAASTCTLNPHFESAWEAGPRVLKEPGVLRAPALPQAMMVNCGVELSTKVPLYALLLGALRCALGCALPCPALLCPAPVPLFAVASNPSGTALCACALPRRLACCNASATKSPLAAAPAPLCALSPLPSPPTPPSALPACRPPQRRRPRGCAGGGGTGRAAVQRLHGRPRRRPCPRQAAAAPAGGAGPGQRAAPS